MPATDDLVENPGPWMPGNVRFPDVEVKLTEVEGNAYAIMAAVSRALRRAGVPAATVDEYRAESRRGDYDHLLQTAMSWVEVS